MEETKEIKKAQMDIEEEDIGAPLPTPDEVEVDVDEVPEVAAEETVTLNVSKETAEDLAAAATEATAAAGSTATTTTATTTATAATAATYVGSSTAAISWAFVCWLALESESVLGCYQLFQAALDAAAITAAESRFTSTGKFLFSLPLSRSRNEIVQLYNTNKN